MDEKPRTFTAPVTGAYHVTSGQEPHLVDRCTEQCEPGAVFTATAGSTVGFENSGAPVNMPTTTTAITFDAR